MNIDLSPKEYRDLLDILHIADVVLSGHRREKDIRSRQHHALIQKLYALAQGGDFGPLIGHNEHDNTYSPTAEFEENSMAHGAIDAFVDHLFWDQLIARLTARDASQLAGGTDRLNALSENDRRALEGPIRQRYVQEFTANGVNGLEIVERFSMGGEPQVRTSD